jgi:hypothetical protein
MGHILKILISESIEGKPSAWGHRLTIEDCEDIHLHYRNRRLEFSDDEFLDFADSVTRAAKELRKKRSGKSDRGMVLDTIKVDPVCKYYPNKFTTEINKGAHHLHYRDLRLDFYSNREFEFFLSRMAVSYIEYIEYRLRSTDRICLSVPMSLINPFDAAHRLLMPGERKNYDPDTVKYGFMAPPNDEHNRTIEEVIKAIKAGKIIRPIACKFGDPILQRKDGFCRYWAHKVLGIKYIDCVIGKRTIPGAQAKKSFIVSEGEYKKIMKGECY